MISNRYLLQGRRCHGSAQPFTNMRADFLTGFLVEVVGFRNKNQVYGIVCKHTVSQQRLQRTLVIS